MISLKPKSMSESELIEQLKLVLTTCDAHDYKTKKFVGLLNDFIPYQTGLKIRLELLAKSGLIEQLSKIKKDAHSSSKIEKMAIQFSKEYGFIYEESYHTISLVAKALQINHTVTSAPSLRIVSAVQGNFSKNHMKNEPANPPQTSGMKVRSKPSDKAQNGFGQSPSGLPPSGLPSSGLPLNGQYLNGQTPSGQPLIMKKRFIRSRWNLTMYVLILLAIPLGYLGLQFQFGTLVETFQSFRTLVLPLSLENPWISGLLVGTIIAIALPYIFKWAFKKNVLSYYPTVIFISQLAIGTIGGLETALVQMGLGVGLFASFGVLAAYAMRLPKGAKEFVAYKALMPYALSVVIWLVGQYVVFYRLV